MSNSKKSSLRRIRINYKDGGYTLCSEILRYEMSADWLCLFDSNRQETGRIAAYEIRSFYWTEELTADEKEEKRLKELEQKKTQPQPAVKKGFWARVIS